MPYEDAMRAMRTLFSLSFTLGLALPALASPRCNAAMTDWKPRQALEDKLRAEGWQVQRIKTDDGCYKVYGRQADGKQVKATFAPDTLILIRQKINDD
jgi:hypothetical protein